MLASTTHRVLSTIMLALICMVTFAAWMHSRAMQFPLLTQFYPFHLHMPPPVFPAALPVGLGSENATLLVLCRESDLSGILSSMKTVESRFNDNYGYPWTFLNEKEFSTEFKEQIRAATRATVSFGVIPREHWYQPDWIDDHQAEQGRMRMKAVRVPYAGSVSYRNMCRFNSGFFFHHPLVQAYRYYWRVEPDIKISCDVPYDPFKYMREHKKIYGFTMALPEFPTTIPNLWSTVREFMTLHPEHVNENNAMDFISDDGGATYNMCHFWSNFEIGDMNFWRSDAYRDFFAYLESKGGFYYERWGDAPVHSIAAALFADKNQLHYFTDIAYSHHPLQTCPLGDIWADRKCDCPENTQLDHRLEICGKRYLAAVPGTNVTEI